MINLTPTQIPVPEFDPVPRKFRYDGWTPDRQRGFIAALAETGSVKAAARRINMSPEGAYYLRRQPGADGFRVAWNAALDHSVQRLEDIAMTRAIEGVAYPVFGAKGQIGTRRSYNDRLLMFILRHRIPHRFGPLKVLPAGTKPPDTLSREEQEAAEAEAQAARDEAWATVNGAIHNLAQLLATLREAWTAAGRAHSAGEAERAEAIDAIAARLVWHLFEGPGCRPALPRRPRNGVGRFEEVYLRRRTHAHRSLPRLHRAGDVPMGRAGGRGDRFDTLTGPRNLTNLSANWSSS